MVEFRLSSGGSAVLMEVNGRYWGTISLPIMCGVDFPNYQWKLFCGEAPTVSADWTARRWRWTAGYMRRLRQLIGAAARPGPARTQLLTDLRQITTDFGLNTADAIWLLQDPAPAASELWEAVRELFVAGAKTTVKVKGAPSSKEEVPSSPTKRTPENSEHIANS